eukprot:CAMPEP_0113466778 /NCGR_PEP_ID=MMETSP0014_2-20120614/14456_1 /TAXON_ID=2857 /ORGANISM="Nitzschia sp." /LENGTH=870 /DNA_ID=CAMNT_0000359029 /DNA_START=1 /DNA_END=2614 /DNA_ORIENTATION=- /assembly_acc=CAM_ASM_000159
MMMADGADNAVAHCPDLSNATNTLPTGRRRRTPMSNRRKKASTTAKRIALFSSIFVIAIMMTNHMVVDAFTTPSVSTNCKSTSSRTVLSQQQNNALDADDNDNENDHDEIPEKSRMNEFARSFLDKMNQNSDDDVEDEEDDMKIPSPPSTTAAGRATTQPVSSRLEDIADATHLVAIPLEQAHELLIELESVQRAILYHCPTLVDACIPPAATRLPLLYVQAVTGITAGGGVDALVTSTIGKVVQKLVDKHVFGSKNYNDDNEDAAVSGDADASTVGINDDGYLPLSLTFQSLEIDGINNSILQTVGVVQEDCNDADDNENDDDDDDDMDESDGVFGSSSSYRRRSRLHDLVSELDSTLSAMGFRTAFPPDPQSQGRTMEENGGQFFRPRVAFMELPAAVDEKLTLYKSPDMEIKEEEMKFLTPQEGGNGISPIFFCRWWDDVFARNIRLREVGVYPRNPFQSEDGLKISSQFFLPYETISLPDGDQNMVKSEKQFQDYQEQRMKEAQEEMEKEMERSGAGFDKEREFSVSNEDSTSSRTAEPDILMKKTRERLERIYLDESTEGLLTEINIDNDQVHTADELASPGDDGTDASIADNDDDSDNSDNNEDGDEVIDDWKERKVIKSDDDYIDDWMKEKIKKAVNSMESEKARNPVKKEVPPIEDNPVFKAYKEGSLNAKSEAPKPSSAPQLGPYPGKDHFVGIWRVVKSPTGFDVDDSKEDRSENIVLRVDGTIAGGPTLDLETRQKAAGGTWKMLTDEDGTVRLRIRLVIPPKKERIMVMEGIVDRAGSQSNIPMASNTFGIPQLEELAKGNEDDESLQLMLCSGEVSIEDAVTKKNRVEIGDFSLMKLKGPSKDRQYTVTVPKPTRNL